jgi:predicted nucleic-acid-binding protein
LKIAADTNVLVRAVVSDDPAQSQAAIAALRGAEQIAVALPALCEFVWVLRWRRGWRSWRRVMISPMR